MGEVAVVVVSDDADWRRGLEAGLRARGIEALPAFDEDVPRVGQRPLAILIDAVEDGSYDAVELAGWLHVYLEHRCPPLVCLGEPETPARDDSELFAAHTFRPAAPAALLDELERVVPVVVGMASSLLGPALVDDAEEA